MKLMDADYCRMMVNEVQYLSDRAEDIAERQDILNLLHNRADHWRQQQALAEEQEEK